MKKLAALTATVAALAAPAVAFAQESVAITQTSGKTGLLNSDTLAGVLTNILTIVFVVAAIIVLFMLIAGAFQWITSGGDKEAVAKARGRITHALIGLVILALAYLILRVVGQLVGVDITTGQSLPKLGS